MNPKTKTGPWTILCDGEGFLRAKVSLAAYRAKKITLWDVPAKSPDMNPIEMYWGWIRRKLRLMDLADLRLKRRPLGKFAYIIRVKNVMKTEKSQTVAKNFARRFRTACQQVLKRGRQLILKSSFVFFKCCIVQRHRQTQADTDQRLV